jgi:hypothetical protein
MSARVLFLGRFGWGLVFSCLFATTVRAQQDSPIPESESRALILRDINLWAATAEPPPPLATTPRIRLPRMPVTTLGDPLGLIDDSDTQPSVTDGSMATTPPDPGGPLQLSMGEDNPFLDFRRHGSPGGVGYFKLHSQLQLLDTGQTGLTVSCQAVRPAGAESNGVTDGASFVSPSVSVFHDLGDGMALHGFVCKDVRANSTWRDGLTDSFRYGVAYQQPIPGLTSDPSRGLFLFVEAQGFYSDRDQGTMHSWEFVPGLHYRMSDDWWISGGVLVPVGPTRYGSTGNWHLSCSWHF